MITLDLRDALARATADLAPEPRDPKLRPAGQPGRYSSSIPFALAKFCQTDPEFLARLLAARLAGELWVASAAVTGNGYVTVTVTREALASVAARVRAAGPACVRSEVLRGVIVPRPPALTWETAATWEKARIAVAAEVTARLAGAAGAIVADGAIGTDNAAVPSSAIAASNGLVADAIAYAGRDAVRLALGRAIPGKPAQVGPADIARHVLDNPAYAVRYAHSRATSGVRWVASLAASGEATEPCLPADPADLALLDALSWLPERVAIAARRGRPDGFTRYLEDLASAAIAAARFTSPADNGRLALARDLMEGARAGLAAGLGLLGVSAPGRL